MEKKERKDWSALIKECMRLRSEIQKAETEEAKEIARQALFSFMFENEIGEGYGMSMEDF